MLSYSKKSLYDQNWVTISLQQTLCYSYVRFFTHSPMVLLLKIAVFWTRLGAYLSPLLDSRSFLPQAWVASEKSTEPPDVSSWLVLKSASGVSLAGLFPSSALVSKFLGPSPLQTWSSPVDSHLAFPCKVMNTHGAPNSLLFWKKQNKRKDFSIVTVFHRNVFISFKLAQAMLMYVVGFCANFHCGRDAK